MSIYQKEEGRDLELRVHLVPQGIDEIQPQKDTHYWNECVFKAYCNHRQDAVFLTGIPDMEATLPHA